MKADAKDCQLDQLPASPPKMREMSRSKHPRKQSDEEVKDVLRTHTTFSRQSLLWRLSYAIITSVTSLRLAISVAAIVLAVKGSQNGTRRDATTLELASGISTTPMSERSRHEYGALR